MHICKNLYFCALIVPNMADFQQGTVTAYLGIRDAKRDIGARELSPCPFIIVPPSTQYSLQGSSKSQQISQLTSKYQTERRTMQSMFHKDKLLFANAENNQIWKGYFFRAYFYHKAWEEVSQLLTLTEHMLLFLSTELCPVLTEQKDLSFSQTSRTHQARN